MIFYIPSDIQGAGLLDFIGDLNGHTNSSGDLSLDFSRLKRITPAGLVIIAANVLRLLRLERAVHFQGLESCSIAAYLQRMDLLKICGKSIPENFQRHDSTGRFVPVRPIDHRVDQMGHEIALCLAPGGEEYAQPLSDLYELIWYVFTETANNVRQHSGGLGCAAAQVTRSAGMVRLALADNGRGILRSFQAAGLEWSQHLTDTEALAKALEPKISCKGEPTNQGVGLTLVSRLAKMTKSWLLIASGTGMAQQLPGREMTFSQLPNQGSFAGTLIVLTFRQDSVQAFADLLHAAKIEAGLLQRPRISTIFKS